MKSLSKKLFILLLSGITYSFAYGQTEPTDKLATRETRNLYLNLQTIAKKGILFGHQEDLYRGHGWRAVP